MTAPVIGFDLDLTLLDTRAGIAATFRELAARTGVAIDVPTVVARLGPPLEQELAAWFPPERVEAAAELYRELYPTYAIDPTVPMPGAEAAVAAVAARGGTVVVITSKRESLARLHLDRAGLAVAELAGNRFGEGKSAAMAELGVDIYVGDHIADVRSARKAGAVAVGVATGPCPADELSAAGADVVLASLTEFPAWLTVDPSAATGPSAGRGRTALT